MFGMGNWNGKKSRGRLRRRLIDEKMKTTCLRLQQVKKAARHRVGWRDVFEIVTRGRLRLDGTR